MENFYTAYTKPINGVPFYFVKHFQTFSEYKNVPPVLENFGMHTDFYKACKIAMVSDKVIQQQLFDTVKSNVTNATVIQMNHTKSNVYNFRTWQRNFPSLLKLINLR